MSSSIDKLDEIIVEGDSKPQIEETSPIKKAKKVVIREDLSMKISESRECEELFGGERESIGKKSMGRACDNSELAVSQLDATNNIRLQVGMSYYTINMSREKEKLDPVSESFDQNAPILINSQGFALNSAERKDEEMNLLKQGKSELEAKKKIRIKGEALDGKNKPNPPNEFSIEGQRGDVRDMRMHHRIEQRNQKMIQQMKETFNNLQNSKNQSSYSNTYRVKSNSAVVHSSNSIGRKTPKSKLLLGKEDFSIKGNINQEVLVQRHPPNIFSKFHNISHLKAGNDFDDPIKEFLKHHNNPPKRMFNGASPHEYYMREYLKEVHHLDFNDFQKKKNLVGDKIIELKGIPKAPEYYARQQRFLKNKYQFLIHKKKVTAAINSEDDRFNGIKLEGSLWREKTKKAKIGTEFNKKKIGRLFKPNKDWVKSEFLRIK